LPDGNLQFLGRLDRQVKVRGNRIELDEISENLRRHPGVSEAAAALRERSGGDPYIVAYFVQAGEADIGQQLRDYLVRKLPNYMVPQHFVRVPSMPLTPSGKLDLKALSKLDLSSDHQVRDPAPEGALEHAIAQVWLDLLKVYHVGRYDNFFDVGGDSLLAIRLVGRLRTLLPQLSLESLYRCPTIASQAEFLRGREIEA
jgi:aryl carrier-like protein